MRTLYINNQDLGDIASIDTYSMFCGSTADEMLMSDYNNEHGTDYWYDNFEWEYNHEQIVKDLANASRKFHLDNTLGPVVKNIGEIVNTGSPKEYNFSTDYYTCNWEIDEQALETFIKKNQANFEQYYRDSGWAEHTEWRENDDPQKAENILIAKLAFYLKKLYGNADSYNEYMWETETDIYLDNTKMVCKEES